MEKIQCPCIKKNGKPCTIEGEVRRNGFCHIHDPKGKFREQQSKAPWNRINKKKLRGKRKKAWEMATQIEEGKHCLPRNKFSKQQVYIFHLGFKGMYKVGISRNWEMRLHALSASNPRIEPVLVFMGSKIHEAAIHKTWSSHRVEREIFAFKERKEFHEAVQNILKVIHPADVIFRWIIPSTHKRREQNEPERTD